MSTQRRLDDYIPFVGEGVITQIRLMSEYLQGLRVQHINSTRLGGGVAELLTRLVPLLNELGIRTEWSVIEGTEDFFTVTKHFHNALHGSESLVSPEMLDVYSQTIKTNADRIDKDADVIIIHDPQPLGLVDFRSATQAHWIWRCHIDVSQADLRVWGFLKPFIDQFDAAVFHIPQFLREDLFIPQFLIPPFIDPLSDKSRDLPEETVRAVLDRHQIATDKPFILQVSRFDRLKDPLGALKAYEIVKRSIDVAFVYVGNFAPDDPEGRVVADEVLEAASALPDTTVIVNAEDNEIVVNALQRAAAVVMQKSQREGFGLVVTEAMWKNRAVVGGDTGGISYQIIDGVTGYLVHTIEGGAYRLRQILSNPPLAKLMGQEARHRVQSVFLLPHYLRNWLGVLLSFKYPGRGVTMLVD
jgi:trehalose synthase